MIYNLALETGAVLNAYRALILIKKQKGGGIVDKKSTDPGPYNQAVISDVQERLRQLKEDPDSFESYTFDELSAFVKGCFKDDR